MTTDDLAPRCRKCDWPMARHRIYFVDPADVPIPIPDEEAQFDFPTSGIYCPPTVEIPQPGVPTMNLLVAERRGPLDGIAHLFRRIKQ